VVGMGPVKPLFTEVPRNLILGSSVLSCWAGFLTTPAQDSV
jgi:hypothetical protein